MPIPRWVRSRAAIEIGALVLIVVAIRAWQHRDVASGTAPSLDGTLLDGQPFTLSGERGRPVMVHFWATWCSICRLEQANIDAIARDARVVTVAMQSGAAADVERHLRAHELQFPVLNDPDGHIAAAWGVNVVPATFIVDADGAIAYTEIGYTTTWGLKSRLWLAGQ